MNLCFSSFHSRISHEIDQYDYIDWLPIINPTFTHLTLFFTPLKESESNVGNNVGIFRSFVVVVALRFIFLSTYPI